MRTVGALALLLVLGACASSTGGAPGTSDVRASLTVRMTLEDGPRYIEGFVPFVRIQQGGATVLEKRMRSADQGWELDTTLPAGSYRVASYVRPCDANCGNLDGPTDSCSTSISVAGGSKLALEVMLRPTKGCTITER